MSRGPRVGHPRLAHVFLSGWRESLLGSEEIGRAQVHDKAVHLQLRLEALVFTYGVPSVSVCSPALLPADLCSHLSVRASPPWLPTYINGTAFPDTVVILTCRSPL